MSERAVGVTVVGVEPGDVLAAGVRPAGRCGWPRRRAAPGVGPCGAAGRRNRPARLRSRRSKRRRGRGPRGPRRAGRARSRSAVARKRAWFRVGMQTLTRVMRRAFGRSCSGRPPRSAGRADEQVDDQRDLRACRSARPCTAARPRGRRPGSSTASSGASSCSRRSRRSRRVEQSVDEEEGERVVRPGVRAVHEHVVEDRRLGAPRAAASGSSCRSRAAGASSGGRRRSRVRPLGAGGDCFDSVLEVEQVEFSRAVEGRGDRERGVAFVDADLGVRPAAAGGEELDRRLFAAVTLSSPPG